LEGAPELADLEVEIVREAFLDLGDLLRAALFLAEGVPLVDGVCAEAVGGREVGPRLDHARSALPGHDLLLRLLEASLRRGGVLLAAARGVARASELFLRLRAVHAELVDREAELRALLAAARVDRLELPLRLHPLVAQRDDPSDGLAHLVEELRQLTGGARL